MMVLITYDVDTNTKEGVTRLRKIAKICVNNGQRVQNSVFECLVDPTQFSILRNKLEKVANSQTDSLRYYFLGSKWKNRVEHFGAKTAYDPEGILIM
ncbi:MAG TPA: CRISPR-associated endonuclease Cas2 [Clostridiales bacterium]|nr:MAG: CRISPR-associated endonuclease Cas2 [Clostridiales bacterium GWD2_32_19]HCC07117.1 CRISPR-associated endonuclease Cas2 [Clostridiales bacterium]